MIMLARASPDRPKNPYLMGTGNTSGTYNAIYEHKQLEHL